MYEYDPHYCKKTGQAKKKLKKKKGRECPDIWGENSPV